VAVDFGCWSCCAAGKGHVVATVPRLARIALRQAAADSSVSVDRASDSPANQRGARLVAAGLKVPGAEEEEAATTPSKVERLEVDRVSDQYALVGYTVLCGGGFEGVEGSSGGLADVGLELGEAILDRVEIGTVGPWRGPSPNRPPEHNRVGATEQ